MFSLWCSCCVFIGPAMIVNCNRTNLPGCSNNYFTCFVEISRHVCQVHGVFFNIVHIAMLTILCRYRLDIGIVIYLVLPQIGTLAIEDADNRAKYWLISVFTFFCLLIV